MGSSCYPESLRDTPAKLFRKALLLAYSILERTYAGNWIRSCKAYLQFFKGDAWAKILFLFLAAACVHGS